MNVTRSGYVVVRITGSHAKRAALYLRRSGSDDEGIERQNDRTTALAAAYG